MSLFSTNKFADAAYDQARNYDRRFRKYVPFQEIVDELRRYAAFDLPLKFVMDRDSQSAGFFRRGPQWDFGNAGVSFAKDESEGSHPKFVVTWSDELEQKTLQDILMDLDGLGFDDEALVSIELISPSGEHMLSRFGNGVSVDRDRTTIHFTGAWQE